MKYNLILFDADDTLFDFAKCEETALEQSFHHYLLDYNRKKHLDLYKQINKSLWSELEKGAIDKDRLKVERFNRLFQQLDIELDSKDFADVYLSFLSKQAHLMADAEEILSSISGKSKIVIITNGIKEVQYKRIEHSIIKKYIDALVVSEEVGYPKPHKEIFDFTLSKVEHNQTNDVLIVGDNLYSDIAGGIKYGIDTCWFNPYGLTNNSDLKPTFEIKQLKELLPILEVER